MYNVSEYPNNSQHIEDADMEENNNLIDIDAENLVKDNENMRDEEGKVTVRDKSVENTNIKDAIQEELLNSGDEKFDTTYIMEGANKDKDYRNSLDELNSEDDIENLEEEENSIEIVSHENEVNRNVVNKLNDDSKFELDQSSNIKYVDDNEEIRSPAEVLSAKLEDNEQEEVSNDGNIEIEMVRTEGENETSKERFDDEGHGVESRLYISDLHQELDYPKEIKEQEKYDTTEQEDDIIKPVESKEITEYRSDNVLDEDANNESNNLTENEVIEVSFSDESKSAESDLDLEITFPVIINIADTDFLLVPFNRNRNPKVDVSHLVSLFDNDDILKLNMEDFFGLVRNNEDLNEIHPFSISKELVLLIPELGDISITEDNVYTRDITIEDFLEAFDCLKSNSLNEGETNIPDSLSLLLTSQTRFITNFNTLSENIREGKGFDYLAASRTKLNEAQSESLDISATNNFLGSSYKRQPDDLIEDRSPSTKRIKPNT